jgi:hypothetical protein
MHWHLCKDHKGSNWNLPAYTCSAFRCISGLNSDSSVFVKTDEIHGCYSACGCSSCTQCEVIESVGTFYGLCEALLTGGLRMGHVCAKLFQWLLTQGQKENTFSFCHAGVCRNWQKLQKYPKQLVKRSICSSDSEAKEFSVQWKSLPFCSWKEQTSM